MRKLLKNPKKYYDPKKRPSGHDISYAFKKNNGGAIPGNLLVFPNSESNSKYLSLCREYNQKAHPARFPTKLPKFFIKFLTSEGDLVLDIFAGSNTTGEAAEQLRRKWLAFEIKEEYIKNSILRFQSVQYNRENRIKVESEQQKSNQIELPL